MEQLYSTEIIENGREIVLSYGGPRPEEVVLTYETDLPPAMCPEEEWEEFPRRRSRKGLYIFLVCLVVLAVTVITIVVWPIERGKKDPSEDGYGLENYLSEDGEITIEAYPVGGDFRLKLSEERETPMTAQEIYAQVNPSVVSVVAYIGAGGSVGTGVIMSEDGYIVTNHHVIAGGEACSVILSSGYELDAKVVGWDTDNDLAVLKVEAEGLPAATFGSSDLLTVGDTVYAIGNPLGLELRGTLTDGIVSAINRDVDVDGITMTLIQTNAALNSGNSGGPLINEYGQVVGINTIKMVSTYDDDATVEGLGFAVPSSTVAHIVNCIISTGEVVPEPVLGITVIGQAILPDGTVGVLVSEVTPGLGGDLAGIEAGDVIVAVDGENVDDNTDIVRIRRRHQAGDTLTMVIGRDGVYYETQVPLMEG